MGSLVLVRHATTTASREGTNLGQARDLPLTPDGIELAGWLGRAVVLELESLTHTTVRLISSPARRCLETAAAIGAALANPAPPELEQAAALREIDYGAWEGLSAEQCRRRDPELRAAWEADPYATTAPGGESGRDVAARAFPVLEPIETWLAEDRSRAAVVVAHNHVLRLRLAVLAGFPQPDYRRRIVVEPGSYSIVTLGPSRRAVRRLGVLPPRSVPGPVEGAKKGGTYNA